MSESDATDFVRSLPTIGDLQSVGPDPEGLSVMLKQLPLEFLESHDKEVLAPTFADSLLPISTKLCRESGDSMARHYAEMGVAILGTLRRRFAEMSAEQDPYKAALRSFKDTLSDVDAFCQWFSEDVSGNAEDADTTDANQKRVAESAVSCVCAYPHCEATEASANCNFMRCSKCFAASGVRVPYCSEKCQKADWDRHKAVCGKSFDDFKEAAMTPQGGGLGAATAKAGPAPPPGGVTIPHREEEIDD